MASLGAPALRSGVEGRSMPAQTPSQHSRPSGAAAPGPSASRIGNASRRPRRPLRSSGRVAATPDGGETLLGDAASYMSQKFPEVEAAFRNTSGLKFDLPSLNAQGLKFDLSSLDTESLKDIASKIPSLQAALANGLGLSDLDALNGASFDDLQAAVNTAVASALAAQSGPASDVVFPAWVAASAVVASVGGLYLIELQNAREQIPQQYDLKALKEYWSRRPLAAARRSSAVTAKIAGWLFRLLLDVQGGEDTIERGAKDRAREMKDIIAGQGPAFVKVGQGIAIRPDLLPPAYMEEMQELLDQVQPFDGAEARRLIVQELGKPLGEVFENVSDFDEPVAAASIGQVYRATLKNGPDGKPVTVAVKCQRPNILESVTLDILTMRGIASFLAALPGDNPKIQQVRTNAEGFIDIVDVAASRFLEEMDYIQEVANAARFEKEMGEVEFVRGMIKVPKVFPEVSTRYIMVTEWVEGRKLTELAKDNTPQGVAQRKGVVTKLLYSYMVQLLETGFLHADPHPGNFLTLDDGRLCIMDYGMMTEISKDQRVAFVEYMAHLSARQYESTLDDLVRLGFVPAELGQDPEKRAIVGPVLAETLETIYSTGGGMDGKVAQLQENQTSRVAALSDKLEEIGREYPLQLPPYFVLILRAFGTLEGLGLSVDENFAVVDECFPYIARRMLSDDDPRIREALRTFIYNGENRLDVAKLEDVAKGFSSFTNTMDADAVIAAAARSGSSSGELDAATRDLLVLLFSPEANYLQDILIDEAVRAVDALSRDALVRVWRRLAESAPAAVALALVPTPFGPPAALVPGFNAIPLLSVLASRNSEAISLSKDDEANLDTLQRLAGVFTTMSNMSQQASSANQGNIFANLQQGGQNLSQEDIAAAQAQAQAVLRLTAPGAASITQRFWQRLAQRLQERAQQDFSNLGFSTDRQ